MYHKIRITRYYILPIFIALFSGCFGSSVNDADQLRLAGEEIPISTKREGVGQEKSVAPQAWQLWANGKTVRGARIINPIILNGDDYFRTGRYTEALSAYNKAPNTEDIEGDLTLRKAAVFLSMRKPKDSLLTLGKYLTSRKIESKDVTVPFCILLGFSYSKVGDSDQALAWFSQAGNVSNLYNPYEQVIRGGVSELLQSLPEEKFESQSITWRSDPFVGRLFSEERYRRTQPGGMVRVQTDSAFVERDLGAQSLSQSNNGNIRIVALLPLTGAFAKLGESTKKGISFALNDPNRQGINVDFVDIGGDSFQSREIVKGIIANNPPQVFLGPLISDTAAEIVDIVRSSRIPMITLAKSEQLSTGGGIYRFGISQNGQMKSLVEKTMKAFPISRFGIVSPNDAGGRELSYSFQHEVEKQGGTVVFIKEYDKTDVTKLSELATNTPVNTVQAVFVADKPANAGRFFASINPDSRVGVIPMGPATWGNQSEFKNSATVFENAVFVAPFFEGDTRPITRNFIDSYKALNGKAPDLLAAQGFDAATLLLALLKQGVSSNFDFERAMAGISMYDGITGRISLSENGEFIRDYPVIQFKDGAFSILGDERQVITGEKSPVIDGEGY